MTTKIWLLATACVTLFNPLQLVSAQNCGRSVRRAWRDLNCYEQQDYLDAVTAIKNNGVFDQFVRVHFANRNAAHGEPLFLPWHRWMLWVFEKELQRATGSCITVPYWDWELDTQREAQSSVLRDNTFGSVQGVANNGCVNRGRYQWSNVVSPNFNCLSRSFFNGVLPFTGVNGLRDRILSNPLYNSFATALEGTPHAVPHVYVGDNMATHYSPDDPLFYLHHANVDRMWTIWQVVHGHEGVQESIFDHSRHYCCGGLDRRMPYRQSNRRFNLPDQSRNPTVRDVINNQGRYVDVLYDNDRFASVLAQRLGTPNRLGRGLWVTLYRRDLGGCPNTATTTTTTATTTTTTTAATTTTTQGSGSTTTTTPTTTTATTTTTTAPGGGDTGTGPYLICLNQQGASWENHRDIARGIGGDLLSIPGQNVNNRAKALARDNGSPGAWIGLSDIDLEGDMEWSDGTAFNDGTSFSDWTNGNSNAAHWDCVHLRPGRDFEWNRNRCNINNLKGLYRIRRSRYCPMVNSPDTANVQCIRQANGNPYSITCARRELEDGSISDYDEEWLDVEQQEDDSRTQYLRGGGGAGPMNHTAATVFAPVNDEDKFDVFSSKVEDVEEDESDNNQAHVEFYEYYGDGNGFFPANHTSLSERELAEMEVYDYYGDPWKNTLAEAKLQSIIECKGIDYTKNPNYIKWIKMNRYQFCPEAMECVYNSRCFYS